LVYIDYGNTILAIKTKDLKISEAESFLDAYKRIQVAVFSFCMWSNILSIFERSGFIFKTLSLLILWVKFNPEDNFLFLLLALNEVSVNHRRFFYPYFIEV